MLSNGHLVDPAFFRQMIVEVVAALSDAKSKSCDPLFQRHPCRPMLQS